MVNPSSYYNAIAALMQPGARLVLTCNRESVVGRSFCILRVAAVSAKRWRKR
jgi:hypothetical protein